MPPNSNALAQIVPAGDNDAVRPQDSDIQDMAAAKDEELAIIFREMRRASGQSFEQLAERLRTQPDVLQTLEEGAISALPPWSETSRIVIEYTALLNLDSRPVLRRLEAGLAGKSEEPAGQPPPDEAAAPQAGRAAPSAAAPDAAVSMPPAATRPTGPPPPPGTIPAQSEASVPASPPQPCPAPPPPAAVGNAQAPRATKAKPQGLTGGTIVTWLLLLLVFGVMGLGVRHAVQYPKAVWSTVDALPEPAARMIHSVWELMRPADNTPEAPTIPDPRSQKSDKLPEANPQGN